MACGQNELRGQGVAVFGLAEGLAEKFLLQHGEIVGHDQGDFLLAPVLIAWLLFLSFLPLADHGEAELS